MKGHGEVQRDVLIHLGKARPPFDDVLGICRAIYKTGAREAATKAQRASVQRAIKRLLVLGKIEYCPHPSAYGYDCWRLVGRHIARAK